MHKLDIFVPARNSIFAGTLLPRCMECRRGLAMRILSLSLFVCLSNACIVTKHKNFRSVQIFAPYEISFSLVFWQEERLMGGGDLFYLKFWVNRPPSAKTNAPCRLQRGLSATAEHVVSLWRHERACRHVKLGPVERRNSPYFALFHRIR